MSAEAAAFHGLATNAAHPISERLALALQALDLYEAEVERLQPVVEAARTRAQVLRELRQFGSGSAGWPERDRDSDCDLLAAVDALDGAS